MSSCCSAASDILLGGLLQWQEARDALPDSIRVVEITIDDSWLRDTAPTVSDRAQLHPWSAAGFLQLEDTECELAGIAGLKALVQAACIHRPCKI